MEMKRLPLSPYLNNIVQYYRENHGSIYDEHSSYVAWLKTFGFKVPVDKDHFEFPEDYSDEQLACFILRWK